MVLSLYYCPVHNEVQEFGSVAEREQLECGCARLHWQPFCDHEAIQSEKGADAWRRGEP